MRLHEEEARLQEDLGVVNQRYEQINTLRRQAAMFSSNFDRERNLLMRAEDERMAIQEKVCLCVYAQPVVSVVSFLARCLSWCICIEVCISCSRSSPDSTPPTS